MKFVVISLLFSSLALAAAPTPQEIAQQNFGSATGTYSSPSKPCSLDIGFVDGYPDSTHEKFLFKVVTPHEAIWAFMAGEPYPEDGRFWRVYPEQNLLVLVLPDDNNPAADQYIYDPATLKITRIFYPLRNEFCFLK